MEPDPFRSIKMKIGWGRTQLGYLGQAIDSLYAGGPYPVVFEDADIAGYRAMKVGRVEQARIDLIACRLGDAVHAFRSALDHFAYMAAGGDKLSISERQQVDFPIWRKPQAVQWQQWAKMVRCKVPNSSERLYKALEALQPYERGKDADLWALDYLDNADKHRALVVLEAAFQGLFTERTAWDAAYAASTPGLLDIGPQQIQRHAGHVHTDVGIFPVQEGDVILTYPVGAYNEAFEPDLPVEIVFGEPPAFRGESIVPIMTRITNATEDTLLRLAKLL
ncbi:MAG: hypothetical protein M3P89_04545 [Actinomycetota bacterium]|nr:hypothetical protein [Actinomycetota bacterium]